MNRIQDEKMGAYCQKQCSLLSHWSWRQLQLWITSDFILISIRNRISIWATLNQYKMHEPQKVILKPNVLGFSVLWLILVFELWFIGLRMPKNYWCIFPTEKREKTDPSKSAVNHRKNEILIGLLYVLRIEHFHRENRVSWHKNQFVRIFIIQYLCNMKRRLCLVVNHIFIGYNIH